MEEKLKKEILKLSIATSWERARKEWELDKIAIYDTHMACICGQNPIKEVCFIKNVKNGNNAIVGNCCVEKFLKLSAKIVFASIKRINKDLYKVLNYESVMLFHSNGIINDWERDFCINMIGKRKISPKREAIIHRINEKVLGNLEQWSKHHTK